MSLTLDSIDSPRQNNFALGSEVEAGVHSLVLFWDPPPQVLEHSDHSVQGEKIGQAAVLHFSFSFKDALHGFASSLTFVRLKPHSRLLERSPPPHVTLHMDQADHGPNPG